MKLLLNAKQDGFSIVTALFVVVILSLIGSYIVSISALSQSSATLTMQGVRAYYAARSGLEWAIYQVAPVGGSAPYNCPANPTTLTFSQGGLANLSATVNCTASTFVPSIFTEDGQTYTVFQIIVTGQYSTLGSADYASRQLYMTVIQPGI